jgi:hypothetical protein
MEREVGGDMATGPGATDAVMPADRRPHTGPDRSGPNQQPREASARITAATASGQADAVPGLRNEESRARYALCRGLRAVVAASGVDQELAFDAYSAAIDQEEMAMDLYARPPAHVGGLSAKKGTSPSR